MSVANREPREDPKLQDEAGRLSALQRYEILDTPSEESFDRIVALVKTIFQVPICTITLIDADRQWFKSCVGVSARETSRDISFCTHTIMDRHPLYVPDAKLDPRFAENPLVNGAPFIRSYLGVPLSTPDGFNVGSLCAIDVIPRNYSPEQIEILKSFGALVVDEFELRRIAQTDFLTGATTRRGFTLELEKALARFKRAEQCAALVMLDIDHFKRVNDTYGHPAGDLVLKTLAAELAGQLRQTDTVGRLGGEEFGVLLPDTQIEDAAAISERLRAHLQSLEIEHDRPLRVTASFGIASLGADVSAVPQWLELADEALYEAKRTGRNRCCVAAHAEAEMR